MRRTAHTAKDHAVQPVDEPTQAWLGMVRTQAIAAAGEMDIRLVESTLALAAALQRKPHVPG
jgi:hypothetical protein